MLPHHSPRLLSRSARSPPLLSCQLRLNTAIVLPFRKDENVVRSITNGKKRSNTEY